MDLENEQAKTENNESEKGDSVFIHIDPGNVRRKLFQEEGVESNEHYSEFGSVAKINEQNGQVMTRSWSKDKEINHQKEMKNNEKERQQEVLLLMISQCKDSNLTNMLKSRANFIYDNVEAFHCYPECALRLCCTHTYSLIFLDLNGDNLDYMMKLASTIRVSTYSNQGTSIVALKHIGTIKDDYWRKFGISDIIYGPLYHGVVDKMIEKWVTGSKFKRDQSSLETVDNVSGTIMKQEEEKVTTFQKPAMHSVEMGYSRQGWSNRNSCSPNPPCDSTDQIIAYSTSDSPGTNTTVQAQEASTYYEQNATQNSTAYIVSGNNPVAIYSSACYSSLTHQGTARQNESMVEPTMVCRSSNVTQSDVNNAKTNSSWNMIQQILDLHQSGQKGIDIKSKQPITASEPVCVSKPVQGQPAGAIYQSSGQASLRSYNGHSIIPGPAIPPNTAYMINGTPGTSSMRISLVPDEYAKHSNKERERRERIKESCDELRKILPKQLIAGRKQDMATVLELTVHYLKAVQNHLPTVIQQQLFQSFLNLRDAPGKRKRKSTESTAASSYIATHKRQRLPTSAMMHGCHLGPYSGPTYLPQMIQGNSQQPSSIGYCPSIYHPMISNSYYGALTPAPSPTPFGAGVGQMAPHIQVSSQIEHDMHTRSQFYNDAPTSQNAVPYYLSASSSSRDTATNSIQKEASHQGHF